MAQQMVNAPIDLNFTNSRRATAVAMGGGIGAESSYIDVTVTAGEPDNDSVDNIKKALTRYDPIAYPDPALPTTPRSSPLDVMNQNDLVYAWRHCSTLNNAKTIADYMVLQTKRT